MTKKADNNIDKSSDKTEYTIDDNVISEQKLMELLESGTTIPEVTISRTESRQKAPYETNQYFISLRLNFEHLWQIAGKNPENIEAHKKIKEHIHSEIMKKEAYLSGILMHLQLKDGVTVYPRQISNPAVKAKNIKEAWTKVNAENDQV